MKRTHKLIFGFVLFAAAFTCLWCLLCPIMFPERVKAANESYQQWLAENPGAKK